MYIQGEKEKRKEVGMHIHKTRQRNSWTMTMSASLHNHHLFHTAMDIHCLPTTSLHIRFGKAIVPKSQLLPIHFPNDTLGVVVTETAC